LLFSYGVEKFEVGCAGQLRPSARRLTHRQSACDRMSAPNSPTRFLSRPSEDHPSQSKFRRTFKILLSQALITKSLSDKQHTTNKWSYNLLSRSYLFCCTLHHNATKQSV